jgi:hypothetical protein
VLRRYGRLGALFDLLIAIGPISAKPFRGAISDRASHNAASAFSDLDPPNPSEALPCSASWHPPASARPPICYFRKRPEE